MADRVVNEVDESQMQKRAIRLNADPGVACHRNRLAFFVRQDFELIPNFVEQLRRSRTVWDTALLSKRG